MSKSGRDAPAGWQSAAPHHPPRLCGTRTVHFLFESNVHPALHALHAFLAVHTAHLSSRILVGEQALTHCNQQEVGMWEDGALRHHLHIKVQISPASAHPHSHRPSRSGHAHIPPALPSCRLARSGSGSVPFAGHNWVA